jgi:acyl carrier protein
MRSKEELIKLLIATTSRELKVSPDTIDVHTNFNNMGMDSLSAMYILDTLEKELNVEINPLIFWEHPTIDGFANQLSLELPR